MDSIIERFVRYTSINTRSNEESTTIPSTQTQVDFATNVLVPDLNAIGLDEVIYNRENGFVIGTLNANTDEKAPAIGFIAHMDTADYNADNIKPRIVENYDGGDICLNEEHQIIIFHFFGNMSHKRFFCNVILGNSIFSGFWWVHTNPDGVDFANFIVLCR